jgi:selenide,water dikinase
MSVPLPTSPDVLVGPATADDAGAIRIGRDLALLHTVDVLTPVVDDPADWGRIAAADALGDVYAMGGRPLCAVQVACWPRSLDVGVLARVLDGAAEVLAAAACPVVGGHTVDDAVPRFGLAVTGVADSTRLLTNAGAHPDDALVLTKPLGTGIVTSAAAADAGADAVLAEAVGSMVTLNEAAAEAALSAGASAATDVTGFGLVGHLMAMMDASGTRADLDAVALPAFDGVSALVAAGHLPDGTRRNRADAEAMGADLSAAPGWVGWLACDVQTSGGLLVAVSEARLESFVVSLALKGHHAWRVGTVREASPGRPKVCLR